MNKILGVLMMTMIIMGSAVLPEAMIVKASSNETTEKILQAYVISFYI
ncbi:MAG: hypothetical protein K2M91_12810 [Lachnospiraceae bacterium]|nr:hypothetical protein [Lachnospiraceae bacterium]